jgi:hypothetical protein
LSNYDRAFRFRCVKGDTDHSYEARLQDVLDVRVSEHRGDGTVCSVVWPLRFTNVRLYRFDSLIPETKGRSLEEMDIIFGAINPDDRAANLSRRRQEQGTHFLLPIVCSANEKVVSELQRSRAEVSMPS